MSKIESKSKLFEEEDEEPDTELLPDVDIPDEGEPLEEDDFT